MAYSRNGAFSNADVDSIETIVELHVRDNEELWLSFVVGTADLTAFAVDFRASADAGWFPIASASGDYTTPEGPVLGASADLTTAAAGATVHWLKLNVKGVHDLRIRAAGTSSTIAGHFGAN